MAVGHLSRRPFAPNVTVHTIGVDFQKFSVHLARYGIDMVFH